MEDILSQASLVRRLRAQGLSEQEIEARLNALDQEQDAQDQAAASLVTAGQLEGKLQVPDQDLQDNQANARAAQLMARGQYQPQSDNVEVRRQAHAKILELRESLGMTKKPGG